jgi:oxygen-dependent protoporphyrinogen oxidase
VRFGAPASALTRLQSGRWRVQAGGETYEADRVVLAIAADAAAQLLAPLDAGVAHELRAIRYAPVVSLALGFERAQARHALDGFGMLIPQREARATLGALFSSTLFPGRAPDGRVLLTAFIGGARNEAVATTDDARVIEQVRADLGALLGIEGEPVFVQLTRWPRAIPQYELGHLERIARIDAALARWSGLHTRANWRDGISVADCVTNAQQFAQRLA